MLGAAWLGPLPRLAAHAFSAHMAMHMAVVAVAAPLLALAWAEARTVPRLAPIPAMLVELVVVWAWHAPALHHAARGGGWALVAEQGSFLVAGVVLWVAALGGWNGGDRGRLAAGVVALLFTAMHMTFLGVLLAVAPRVLYGHSLAQQHWGGVVMLGVGGAVYLAGGLVLTGRLLRARRLS